MGGRYWRTFECEDCGVLVTRMWQSRQPKVCGTCATVRARLANEAAHEAVEAYKRACRLELAARRVREAALVPPTPVRPAALFEGGGLPGPPPRGP